MVIDDSSQNPQGPRPNVELSAETTAPILLEDRLASPTDRIAAVVADFVIVSPLAALLMAPFRRIAEEASLQSHDEQSLFATATGFAAAVLLVIAYQTFFLMKWRATPGKRLLGLTVESLWQDEGARMGAQSALLRSIAWCFEAALAGLPWIAVIGNERRRPFHDRLADTIVLSKKKSQVGPPGVAEMSLASGLVAAFFTSLLIVVTFKIGASKLGFNPRSVLADTGDAAPSGGACEQVDHAEKTWIQGLDEKKPSRIGLALALYEADAIDEDCLKAEADSALWKLDDKDLAYLARGLSEKNDDDLSQSYLDKSCSGSEETDACKALAFLNDEELPDDPVEAKAAKVAHESEILSLIGSITPRSEPFLKILAIRELTSRHQSAQALAMIDAFAPQHDLSFFLSSERMKTLWALNRKDEARLSMKAAISGYDSDERVAMSRWFCQTETSEAGCSAHAKSSCDLLSASVDHDKVLLGDPDVTLAYIRGETCANRLDEKKLASLKTEMPDLPSQNYVDALTALTTNEAKGVLLLRQIAEKDDENPFITEAQAKLVELAKTEKDLTSIREAWFDTDSSSDGWAYLGRRLMARYNSFKAWDQTIEVGFKMGESEPLDPSAARSLIIAAYRSGQTKMAMGYLQTYFGSSFGSSQGASNSVAATVPMAVDDSSSLRQPASVMASSDAEFDEVAQEIRTDFDNGVYDRQAGRKPSATGSPAKLPAKLPAKKHRSGR